MNKYKEKGYSQIIEFFRNFDIKLNSGTSGRLKPIN